MIFVDVPPLPDGAREEGLIVIRQYSMPNDRLGVDLQTVGELGTVGFVGLMEMAKIQYVRKQNEDDL